MFPKQTVIYYLHIKITNSPSEILGGGRHVEQHYNWKSDKKKRAARCPKHPLKLKRYVIKKIIH